MKKCIKYLIYIIVIVLFTTNNILAAEKDCMYYTEDGYSYLAFTLKDKKDVKNIELYEDERSIIYYGDSNNKSYDPYPNLDDNTETTYEMIYGGTSLREKDWDEIPSECPKYIEVRINFNNDRHIYKFDTPQDASKAYGDEGVAYSSTYKGRLYMGLNGKFSEGYRTEDVIAETTCNLEYQRVDNSANVSNSNFYLKDMNYNLVFAFNKYKNGKKEFCVTMNKSETACAESSQMITMEFAGKKYKYQIEQKDAVLNAYFPNDKCLDNKSYCMREIDGVYTFTTPVDGVCNIIDVTPGDGDKACKYKDNVYYGPDGKSVSKSEFDELCNIDCGIFGGEFGRVLKIVLSFVRFLVPIIIIGLTIVDFIKATTAHDESLIKQAANKVVKRMIIGVIIFVLPTILEFVLALADIEYGTCGIK